MNNIVDKKQLELEIAQVIKILGLAEERSKRQETRGLAMNFMRTQKTGSISPIEVTEYLAYISDKWRYEGKGDIEAANETQENIDDSLTEINKELQAAHAVL